MNKKSECEPKYSGPIFSEIAILFDDREKALNILRDAFDPILDGTDEECTCLRKDLFGHLRGFLEDQRGMRARRQRTNTPSQVSLLEFHLEMFIAKLKQLARKKEMEDFAENLAKRRGGNNGGTADGANIRETIQESVDRILSDDDDKETLHEAVADQLGGSPSALRKLEREETARLEESP